MKTVAYPRMVTGQVQEAPCIEESSPGCIPRYTNTERCLEPKQFYITSSTAPGQVVHDFVTDDPAFHPRPLPFNTGFEFKIPEGYCLWSLNVDYPLINGQVQIGDNQPAIPVRAGVLFNLTRDEFPCGCLGNVQVRIFATVAADVNWGAIIGEP